MSIFKVIDKIYSETDLEKSISTSFSGIISLLIYLKTNNVIIAVFALIIIFPIFRVFASYIDNKIKIKLSQKKKLQDDIQYIDKFTEDEKTVIKAYINNGGTLMTWNKINNLNLPRSGVESLIQREIIYSTMTGDVMHEAFAIDTTVFDMFNWYYKTNG